LERERRFGAVFRPAGGARAGQDVCLLATHGLGGWAQLDAVGVVDEAVEDGIICSNC